MKISLKKSKIQPGVTPIENLFLDIYLSKADEISLKLYLFLYKRIFGSYSNELTFDMISDELNFSEIQIKNALKFWKNEGVLDFYIGDGGEIETVEFYNFYALYSGTLSVDEDEKMVIPEKPLIDTDFYVSKIENLIGLTLQPYEISKILDCIEETRQGWDLVYRAYLHADTLGKTKSTSYIIGILRGWKRDNNIVTQQDLDNFLNRKDSRKKIGYGKKLKKYIENKDMLTEDQKNKKLADDKGDAVSKILKGF